jgi:hypothetical protein
MSEEPKIQKGPLSGVPFEFLVSWSDKGIRFSDPFFCLGIAARGCNVSGSVKDLLKD